MRPVVVSSEMSETKPVSKTRRLEAENEQLLPSVCRKRRLRFFGPHQRGGWSAAQPRYTTINQEGGSCSKDTVSREVVHTQDLRGASAVTDLVVREGGRRGPIPL